MQFRKDSPSDDIFVLPKLPNTSKRTRTDRRILSTLRVDADDPAIRFINTRSGDYPKGTGPVRLSKDASQHQRDCDGILRDMLSSQHSSNHESARNGLGSPRQGGFAKATRFLSAQRCSHDQLVSPK